jgi:transketolase
MVVVCPVDAVEAKKATRAIAEVCGPAYLRLGRGLFPIITKESDAFELGKANVLTEGSDVTLIGCGLMVSEALRAADTLAGEGVKARVVNMHTIKPLDEETIVRAAAETGAIVTAEEHQMYGGLGGAVAEVLVKTNPVPQEMVAVRDTFGESGDPEALLRKYHLKDADIVKAAREVLRRKE